jgi:hypothetical protein
MSASEVPSVKVTGHNAMTKRKGATLSTSDQWQRFVETARELRCEEDEEAFKAKLRRVAQAPLKPATVKGTRAGKAARKLECNEDEAAFEEKLKRDR